MASIPRTYIQQLSYDGSTYKKGAVVDTLASYHVACIEFPFSTAPKSQKITEREWPGVDGKDVYVPAGGIPLDDYDMDVNFIYKGTIADIAKDMTGFLDFLRGRNKGAVGGRLAIYDEHVGFGRKDVIADEVDEEMYKADPYDPDALFNFKVKFHVYDPSTEVTLTKDATGAVTDLAFSVKGD